MSLLILLCSLVEWVSLGICDRRPSVAQADHDTLEARLEEMELLVQELRKDEAAAATQAEATKHAIRSAQVWMSITLPATAGRL